MGIELEMSISYIVLVVRVRVESELKINTLLVLESSEKYQPWSYIKIIFELGPLGHWHMCVKVKNSELLNGVEV